MKAKKIVEIQGNGICAFILKANRRGAAQAISSELGVSGYRPQPDLQLQL